MTPIKCPPTAAVHHHESTMSDADAELVLAEVDRFARREIEPRVERPERSMDARALAAVIAAADAMGLAGAEEPTGLGLWEDADGTLTLAILRRLGRANAAVALALHQRALGHELARRLGFEAPLVAIAWGGHGIGRDAAARLLAGAPLSAADLDLLTAVWGRHVARVLTCDDDWGALAMPVVAASGALGWELWPRSALAVTPTAHAHGFDELVTATIVPVGAGQVCTAGDAARAVWGFALGATALAHVAIACGAVVRGHALARAYAAQRQQGGAMIDRHDAVRLLLARGTTVLDLVFAAALAAAPRSPIAALGVRAEAMPSLTAAANDALQAFGGLGYMRDTGVEKVVRDVNHLRVLGGSPGELALVISEWERLHDRAA